VPGAGSRSWLAWNFAQSIVAKNAAYRAAGGQFVVPLPAIEVI
jgi:hypothetical protein